MLMVVACAAAGRVSVSRSNPFIARSSKMIIGKMTFDKEKENKRGFDNEPHWK
jgi:hypothetical protein